MVVVGAAPELLREKYALVVEAMNAGITAARPGARMRDVCAAINTVLEAQGYGEYCYPPHIRRRGHGLGLPRRPLRPDHGSDADQRDGLLGEPHRGVVGPVVLVAAPGP